MIRCFMPCWSGAYDNGDLCSVQNRWNTFFTANGGYYDPNLLCNECSRRFPDGLFFLNYGGTFASAYYGALAAMAPVRIVISDGGEISVDQQESNPNRLRLAFDVETGVFSGTMRLDFEGVSTTGTYRGVIIPGWGGCDTCGRLGALGSGALWFSDFLDAGGTRAARSGFAVEINNIEDN